ncbi:WYL domain-containing protein [Marinobacterium ramblicola]|uniref:WYL domain-containing protein n=1 Tax=Marinobacterium ramblicola TaxID=2849041 RepID=UPI003CCE6569
MGWTGRWTLLAWCETRQDYRNFRFDRFEALRCLNERFETTPDIGIGHFFETVIGVPDHR